MSEQISELQHTGIRSVLVVYDTKARWQWLH